MVSQFCVRLTSFEVGLTQNLVDNVTLSITCTVGIHVGFTFVQTTWSLRVLKLYPVYVEVEQCQYFSTNEKF